MSKERAKRRAEREAERERVTAERAVRTARTARRRDLQARVTRALIKLLPGRVKVGRPGGSAASRRRTENKVLLAVWAVIQVVTWILIDSWLAWFGVLIVSLMLVPVLATLLFDRRS